MSRQPLPLPPWAVQACRLWRRPDAPGLTLTGAWGGVKVFVFENPEKRDGEDADFLLCFAAPTRRATTAYQPPLNQQENNS